ncbi:MAG: hypothetical protein HZA16_12280 [Nitrospirae bacterium]|nr:hypothetical protein [Nitrospirota bacterium]
MKILYLLLLMSMFLYEGRLSAQSPFDLPPLPPSENYGDIVIDRTAKATKGTPVYFSHWVHRVKYTCRVCHYELEFSMQSNETPIVCDNGTMKGRYCAACHNGKVSFGPKDEDGETCSRCHDADSSSGGRKFNELQNRLPKSRFGNGIDWSRALNDGLIKPADSLSGEVRELVNVRNLVLEAEMRGISYAVFPHRTHEQWLDCSSCHPELFNIKKKSTESLRMINMIRGDSCGVCHLRVAFPLDDCKKCHPKMRNWGGY